MRKKMNKQQHLLLGGIFLLIALVLHFYNLNWGAPFYFHPDERNIASAISQLRFPLQMNPHFFAYGSLPIYFIYFIGFVYNLISLHCFTFVLTSCGTVTTVLFEQAILISRIVAAVTSLLLIPLIYLIGKELKNVTVGLIAAFFATTSVGFIQFSHFGTYEMLLTFFTTLLFFICLFYIKAPTKLLFFWMSLVSGILLSLKISSGILLPIPLIIIGVHYFHHTRKSRTIKRVLLHSGKVYLSLLLYVGSITLLYVCTNPYTFLDKPSFLGSMRYESTVALGTLPVFYTGEFYQSIPVLFSFTNVYPFLINPLLTASFLPCFLYLFYLAKKKRKSGYVLLAAFFLVLFASQAFLYVQWVRYLLPTLPFVYLILAVTIEDLYTQRKEIFPHFSARVTQISGAVAVMLCSLFALSFFIADYVEQNTVFAAVDSAQKTIPSTSPILSETYDLGITPFNPHFSHIHLYNFYDLDNNSPEATSATLATALAQHDYIILPSQRVLKVRLMNAKKFPLAHQFYADLLNDKTNFRLFYQTPCDIFCKIAYNGNPIFSFEETATVFDRPTVLIFKKQE